MEYFQAPSSLPRCLVLAHLPPAPSFSRVAGRELLQKTLIRVAFSQPGKRIITSIVRHGPEMLLEWDGCDEASGRKQQQEKAQHGCT